MLTGLMLAAFLMGVAGVPHCATMCGAACATVWPRGVSWWALAGRCTSYALLGAVAASGSGLASSFGRQFAFLQPFWVLAQCAVLGLGLWLLVTARMPVWMDEAGQGAFQSFRAWWRHRMPERPAASSPRLSAWMAGMAWAVLPCGLLYAAVMTAALAEGPVSGAVVMLCFAVPGAVAVWAAPVILARLRGRQPTATPAATPVPIIWMQRDQGLTQGDAGADLARSSSEDGGTLRLDDARWAVRASGLLLAGMSLYAIWHLLWVQWQAWCA